MSIDIDFVVLWVDCNDPDWQIEKKRYLPNSSDDISMIRYQSWDNLHFWFRSVEKYAPWVRRIHLVTNGQVPQWINTEHPKLHLVKHSDYMPSDSLPVFNSSAIEVGIHKIEGLAEHFVYFNDDIFLTDFVSQSYFFNDGVPKDMPGLIPFSGELGQNVFAHLVRNNTDIINKHFSKAEILWRDKRKWFKLSYGKTLIRTILNLKYQEFSGFVMPHLSTPYIIEDFNRVWDCEGEVLKATQYHRFRSFDDVTHLLFRNWRICEGRYWAERSKGHYFSLGTRQQGIAAARAIIESKYPEVCLNETCSGEEFEKIKGVINQAFMSTLPTKSSFEI